MTRCNSCGTLFDEVRWVVSLPLGTVRATHGSCPACSTGRLPRWGIAPDLIVSAALRTFLVSVGALAVWLVLVYALDVPLRCVWPVLGLFAVHADPRARLLPTFVRRWVTSASVCAALLVAQALTVVIGDAAAPSPSLLLGWLERLGPVLWILVSTLVASIAVSLHAPQLRQLARRSQTLA